MRTAAARGPLLLALVLRACVHASADCMEESERYLSLVDTMGLHVVCVETPWKAAGGGDSGGEALDSISVHVFRNSLRSERQAITLTAEGSARSSP